MWTTLATALALLTTPATAAAADRFVDFDTGDDQGGTNDCLTQGTPCKTIERALAESGLSNDTILVDDDTYPEHSLVVGAGKTLTESNFVPADTGEAILDPGSNSNPVISTVLAQAATVSNLTIRNDSGRLIDVNGPALIQNNLFDEDNFGDPTTVAHMIITGNAGNPNITGNVFSKVGEGGTAIRSLSTLSPSISGNQIASYNGGIDLQAGMPVVTGNEISGLTGSGNCAPCSAIAVNNSQATLTANTIHEHAPSAAGGISIGITEFPMGPATSAVLSRNVVRGGGIGIFISEFGGSSGPVTLFGDSITGYAATGIDITEFPVTATNVTVASAQPGVMQDIDVINDTLTLDSSIVSNTGITTSGLGACNITFSRGPVAIPGPPGCQDFQSTADPMFTADFHLLTSSPLIDAGDPTPPPPSRDIDGEARVLDGNCDGVARRDMGADEVLRDCTPPATPPAASPTPPVATPKKKCKKRKKRAGAARKCKRKRRR